MATPTIAQPSFVLSHGQGGFSDRSKDALQERVEDRFQLMDVAGMGFFGIVFYAMSKADLLIESSLIKGALSTYDSKKGLQSVQAVKLCNPLCPSGVKASAGYVMKDITAMKRIWSRMEGSFQHNFVRLLSYSTSETPWYSMEPVMSGLTLEQVYLASQAQGLPLTEELAFHLVSQMTQACLFLYNKCNIVRADSNRENIMLRFPGRHSKLLPDVVLVDWSLWEEANPERIARDTEDVYRCLFPVIFEGGWKCGASHNQHDCTIDGNAAHSPDWLHLYRVFCAKHTSFQDLECNFFNVVEQRIQRIATDALRAERVRALLMATQASFTEEKLRSALSDM